MLFASTTTSFSIPPKSARCPLSNSGLTGACELMRGTRRLFHASERRCSLSHCRACSTASRRDVCRKQASNRRGRNSDPREWFLARARLGGRGGVWLEKGRHAYCEWCGARRCSRLLGLPKPPRPGVHEKGLVPWRKGLCIQALISGLIKPSAIGFLWMFARKGALHTRGMGLESWRHMRPFWEAICKCEQRSVCYQ